VLVETELRLLEQLILGQIRIKLIEYAYIYFILKK